MLQQGLFCKKPLAELIRPSNLNELIGCDFKFSDNQSVILYGPPGTGKSSFAKIMASSFEYKVFSLSGVSSSVQDFRSVFDYSKKEKATLLIDEIHHLTRSQQDIFLPYIEDGSVLLIGTTTENPSFALRPALLSRCKVFVFDRLSDENLLKIFERAEDFLNYKFNISHNLKEKICNLADGDARYLINMIEDLYDYCCKTNNVDKLSENVISNILNKRFSSHDKNQDNHYGLISALHKSVRGSDPDAAIYWYMRMINSGEDPLYIARRVIRMAVEDIGLADPGAVNIAISCYKAYQIMGSPEGELAIANAVVYLATAPKSNAVYKAFNEARDFVKKTSSYSPPKHILNAPTKFMKDIGISDGYIYDPDTKDSFSGQNYFPKEIGRRKFYSPYNRGFEREINKRLDYWNKLRTKLNN